MSKSWRWIDIYLINVNSKTSVNCYHDALRKAINQHGIYTRDSSELSIFSILTIGTMKSLYMTNTFDLIFEYRPDLTLFSKSNPNTVVMDFEFLRRRNHVVLKKFLEQDIDYRYIRCRYAQYGSSYNNFMCFLDRYNNTYNKGGRYDNIHSTTYIFRNHFYKGITFFELMKHQLFK